MVSSSHRSISTRMRSIDFRQSSSFGDARLIRYEAWAVMRPSHPRRATSECHSSSRSALERLPEMERWEPNTGQSVVSALGYDLASQEPGMSNGALSGRIAVVTGASAGIGEAVARSLHASGAAVVINARRTE